MEAICTVYCVFVLSSVSPVFSALYTGIKILHIYHGVNRAILETIVNDIAKNDHNHIPVQCFTKM